MLIKDVNILREHFERRLKQISPDSVAAYCTRMFLDAIDDLPTIEVVSADEYESLLRRFRHLIQSDYIRSFDELGRDGKYKRDISEAGKLAGTATRGKWYLAGATQNAVAKWECTCCGFIVRVEGFRRPLSDRCPACNAIIDGCLYEPNYSPFDGHAMTQAEYFGLSGGGGKP